MTALYIFLGAVAAVALGLYVIRRHEAQERRSRYAAQVTPRDERGPGHPDIDAFLADLSERNERRRS